MFDILFSLLVTSLFLIGLDNMVSMCALGTYLLSNSLNLLVSVFFLE